MVSGAAQAGPWPFSTPGQAGTRLAPTPGMSWPAASPLRRLAALKLTPESRPSFLMRVVPIAGTLVLCLLPMLALAQDGAPPPTSPPASGGSDGFSLRSTDGEFELRIGLLAHLDARFAASDRDEAVTDTFAVRRARPYLRGRVGRLIEFHFNPDFAGGTLVVQDAYVDTIIARAVRIRIGKAKAPFGLERLHSGANLLFLERALPTALAPNRDVGVQVLGDLAGGAVNYAAALMNGAADGGSTDADTNDAKDVVGRLVVRPFRGLPGGHPLSGLGLALSGAAGRQAGSTALPAFRTTTLRQSFFAYSGATADGTRTRYSPQVFYYHRNVGTFAEFIRTRVPVTAGDARERIAHTAWQVAGSVVLTGEAAGDAGVRPRAAFDPGRGQWGAVEVAARYHALEVDVRAFEAGFAAAGASRTARAWTFGVNWYLSRNFKHVFNYERTAFSGHPDEVRATEHAFVVRTQLSF